MRVSLHPHALRPRAAAPVLVIVLLAMSAAAALPPSVLHDGFEGTTAGALVGSPPPAFEPGVVGQGIRPMRGSVGAAVAYATLPPPSGLVSFTVRVAEPVEFYRGPLLGLIGREHGNCNDFFIQATAAGLDVAIFSGPGGAHFRSLVPVDARAWEVGSAHHIALAYGFGQPVRLTVDGATFDVSEDGRAYVEGCGAPDRPFLFGASRTGYASIFSPGALVFDELALVGLART